MAKRGDGGGQHCPPPPESVDLCWSILAPLTKTPRNATATPARGTPKGQWTHHGWLRTIDSNGRVGRAVRAPRNSRGEGLARQRGRRERWTNGCRWFGRGSRQMGRETQRRPVPQSGRATLGSGQCSANLTGARPTNKGKRHGGRD